MRFAGSPTAMNALNAVSGTGVDYSKLAGEGQRSRSREKQNAFASEAKLKVGEEESRALVEAAKEGAAGIVAQGQAAGHSAMMGGLSSGISSLAGGFANMGSSGGGGGFYSPVTDIGGTGMTYSQGLVNPNIPQGFAPAMSTNFSTGSFFRR